MTPDLKLSRSHVIAAALLLLLAGCADTGPRPTHHTPAGTPVVVPAWLTDRHDLVAEALDEIDAGHAHHGIAPGEVLVVIEPPYIVVGDVLARGSYEREYAVARVGWRVRGQDNVLLPALRHELGHHIYGPEYEH